MPASCFQADVLQPMPNSVALAYALMCVGAVAHGRQGRLGRWQDVIVVFAA
jgi:hypothetical protein